MSRELLNDIDDYKKITFSFRTKFMFGRNVYKLTPSHSWCFKCALSGNCHIMPCDYMIEYVPTKFTITKVE